MLSLKIHRQTRITWTSSVRRSLHGNPLNKQKGLFHTNLKLLNLLQPQVGCSRHRKLRLCLREVVQLFSWGKKLATAFSAPAWGVQHQNEPTEAWHFLMSCKHLLSLKTFYLLYNISSFFQSSTMWAASCTPKHPSVLISAVGIELLVQLPLKLERNGAQKSGIMREVTMSIGVWW